MPIRKRAELDTTHPPGSITPQDMRKWGNAHYEHDVYPDYYRPIGPKYLRDIIKRVQDEEKDA